MRVGVVGSWRQDEEWALRDTPEQFAVACRSTGRELARRRQTVIVGGDAPHTADHHVVRGVLEIVQGTYLPRPVIEVLTPKHVSESYRKLADEFPGMFGFHSATQTRWTETHLLAVREADCVLAIGGLKGTYHAGFAAIVARKTVVPVGSFGGAAARLLREMPSLDPASGDARDLLVLNGPWNSSVLDAALRKAGVGRQPRIMLVHGHSSDRYELQAWLQRQNGLCKAEMMQQEYGAGRTLPEKFEDVALTVDGAIAIATADDLGAAVAAVSPALRARQNVWLEIGWFWGRFGRPKILLLCKGELEIPSDLIGVEFYRYREAPSERAEEIRRFVQGLTGAV